MQRLVRHFDLQGFNYREGLPWRLEVQSPFLGNNLPSHLTAVFFGQPRSSGLRYISLFPMPQRHSVARGDSQRIVVPPGRVSMMPPRIGDGLLVGRCGDLELRYVARWESPELRFGIGSRSIVSAGSRWRKRSKPRRLGNPRCREPHASVAALRCSLLITTQTCLRLRHRVGPEDLAHSGRQPHGHRLRRVTRDRRDD
jgi:hypothetical protein